MSGFSSTFKIGGLDKLAKKLDKVGEEMREKIARKATGTAAAIIRDEAKRIVYTAPRPYRVYNSYVSGSVATEVEPGHVARNIIMKYLPYGERDGMTSAHVVTVSMSQDGPYGARNIGVFLEYGINQPQPHPFMRPAYERKKSTALAAATKVIHKEIGKIWKQQ